MVNGEWMETIGRTVLIIGGVLVLVGLLMVALGKLGLGRLPGDILYRRDAVTIYFPIVTMILLSIILSLLLTFIFWLMSRGR